MVEIRLGTLPIFFFTFEKISAVAPVAEVEEHEGLVARNREPHEPARGVRHAGPVSVERQLELHDGGEALAEGCSQRVLLKPWNGEELHQTIAEVLQG